MKQILGVHIGVESIGWALVRYSSNPRIVNMGKCIFSSFVNHLGEGDRETSNATIRLQQRGTRKIHLRKTYRKQKIRSFLIQHDLCPSEGKKVLNVEKISSSKHYKKIQEWFALNPYELRAKGISKPLSKHELGRVLYHMSQRRGKMLSSEDDKTRARILLEGLPAANRIGIRHTEQHP
jgi:CRISPR-associated endonuclease Csn1